MYQGQSYTVPANGEISVPADVATFWKNIHEFLLVSNEKTSKKEIAPVEVTIAPVVVETKTEEPVKATPKKK